MARITEFVVALASGGTWEIVLLIVLAVVALLLLALAVWLAWKLLVLLAKGLLWLFNRGGEAARTRRASQQEAKLAAPPLVSTGWGGTARLGLRVALAEAARLAGPDALRIVVLAGSGGANLCRSLGLTAPGVGALRIAAGGDILLIDASAANGRQLRRLAHALSWRRPVDGVAVLVDEDSIPSDAVARAARFARVIGMRVALHFVLPSAGRAPAWRIIDANNSEGDAICSQLAGDAMRIWLVGGEREGLKELAVAQSRELPAAINRALAVAPASLVDVASLGFSGMGLRGAVAQTVSRTRPATAPGLLNGVSFGALAVGILLTALATFVTVDRTADLRSAVNTAAREAEVPWTATGVYSIPSGARVRRVAGIGTRLAEFSEISALTPLAALAPDYFAPERLGAVFLESYMLRPLATALELQAQERLVARDDPRTWIEDARVVGEWVAAWEGLADDPEEVDLQALLAAGFGGDRQAWPSDIDAALVATGVEPPQPRVGGLDVEDIRSLARDNFIQTMQRWADGAYTNGPVATAARAAGDTSTNWREQHAALVDLRRALQDPAQQWLTAAEDRSDHSFELRMLGRALALSLIGNLTTAEAKAAVSAIRIDARSQAVHYILPGVGPILTRASQGQGPSLSMTPAASAWLSFLDKVANAGFANLPDQPAPQLAGPVTVNPVAAAAARGRLRVFEQFALNLPAELDPALARKLVAELASELVVGVTSDVEHALRPASDLGTGLERAERRARAAATLGDLAEVEEWLRGRLAASEADRVQAARARIAAAVLEAATDALSDEDPLGVHPDPAADGNAIVRRFERGVVRLTRIHEQFAAPFVEAAGLGSSWAALHWRDMSADLAGYARGDADSTISGLEGAVRAFAEDPEAACDAPRPLLGRGDYLARASLRFRDELDRSCDALALADAVAAFTRVKTYFDEHVAWLWPYSRDVEAPEISASTLSDFVRHLKDGADFFPLVEDPLAAAFVDSEAFWAAAESAVVRFAIRWRARPGEEHLAEHLAELRIDGAQQDEAGVYVWRYGAPFTLYLRMAKNSPYDFVLADGRRTDELVLTRGGNGALLRLFADLADGALTFEADVVDEFDGSDRLRLSARVLHDDGRPMTLPRFNEAGF